MATLTLTMISGSWSKYQFLVFLSRNLKHVSKNTLYHNCCNITSLNVRVISNIIQLVKLCKFVSSSFRPHSLISALWKVQRTFHSNQSPQGKRMEGVNSNFFVLQKIQHISFKKIHACLKSDYRSYEDQSICLDQPESAFSSVKAAASSTTN